MTIYRINEARKRYEAALHAMQTAVKMKMTIEGKSDEDKTETGPKHLRVGVNSAMVDTGTLVRVLVKKKIITELEFLELVADEMESEVDRYRKMLNIPDNVKLG